MIAWSCGGGLQSTALAVLIREGALPRPDLSGIADTGRERRATWGYLRDVLAPYLRPAGVEVEVVPHGLARVDLFGKDGKPLVPAYDGAEGRLGAYCSGEWKRDVMERWLRSKGVRRCVNWIGYSFDEQRRMAKKPHRPWCVPAYPLIERRLTKAACLLLVEKAGLPRPPKSRCWCCPHQNAAEWAEVRADPEEWAQAVALDEEIRAADERGGLFLHGSRVPLARADLGVEESMPLFRGCQDAGCFT